MNSASQDRSERGRAPHPRPSPRSAALLRSPVPRRSPGRLVERNCADMQLLDLVDGADGEGAVVGQGQAGKKGLGLD